MKKTRKKGLRMGVNSYECPTQVLLTAAGSVDTELFCNGY